MRIFPLYPYISLICWFSNSKSSYINIFIWLVVCSFNPEKYEFVSWDDYIPERKNRKHVPNHQPGVYTVCAHGFLKLSTRYPHGWVVYFMVNPIKMNDWGYPYFRKPPHLSFNTCWYAHYCTLMYTYLDFCYVHFYIHLSGQIRKIH